ncbi:rod shape-determining protein MreC [Patescibacteria group bacterium]|nr:rod shape-determining protein MreC [Patescibacteria group bacterium]MBU1246759.1 rod shape-determining protein MreC [Patescibacteria group bacterium]MBU1519618.1 rod shape-determining protein MreC [Patescibacteria group bacterium]MBU1956658.1 rod shape-determining protein MreC [Patescibacteria group bacterium]MBU2009898.1 rod shape-determining protein MreC [Patescibacteria group bacterium]
MMMRHGKKNNKVKIIILIIGIGLFFAFFNWFSASTTSYLHRVATPLWRAGGQTKEVLTPFLSYFTSRRALFVENQNLQQQIDATRAKLADRSFLLHENNALKEKLERSTSTPERILAVILAKPDITLYDTLIIDVGEQNKVSLEDLVMVENIVMGEIAEVYQTSSKVKLYSSPGVRTPVFVGDSAISTEAIGLGGGNFKIELPQNVDIFVGDSIYMPSISPRVLGIIEHIDEDANNALEEILFRSPISFFSLRFVDVVKPLYDYDKNVIISDTL